MTGPTSFDIELRRLTVDDAGEALTVQRAAFVAEGRTYNSFDIPPLAEELDSVRVAIVEHIVVGAFAGSRLVGSARLVVEPDDGGGPVGWVSRVAVAPDLQGRGIGRRLVEAALDAAPEGLAVFRLAAAAGSLGNVALYESIGFGEIDRSVDVAGVDMIIMELRR